MTQKDFETIGQTLPFTPVGRPISSSPNYSTEVRMALENIKFGRAVQWFNDGTQDGVKLTRFANVPTPNSDNILGIAMWVSQSPTDFLNQVNNEYKSGVYATILLMGDISVDVSNDVIPQLSPSRHAVWLRTSVNPTYPLRE